jgi:hypothetical protein
MEGLVEKFTLGAVDYVILGLFIVISASIGVYYRFSGGKQKSTKVGRFILITSNKIGRIISCQKNRNCEFVINTIN